MYPTQIQLIINRIEEAKDVFANCPESYEWAEEAASILRRDNLTLQDAGHAVHLLADAAVAEEEWGGGPIWDPAGKAAQGLFDAMKARALAEGLDA